MTRKISALVLAIMFFTSFASAVFAYPVNLDGLPFCGAGTENEPYRLSSAEELVLFSELVRNGSSMNGIYFILTDDIDMSGTDFSPIGCEAHPFAGSFDGLSHTVSNLCIDTDADFVGLFGCSTGVIRSINITDSVIRGGGSVGSVLGKGAAENCFSSALVYGVDRVGGIIGDGTAFDCVFTGSVTGETRVGGVTGEGSAYRSVNRGCVSGVSRVGGVSGLGVDFDSLDEGSFYESEHVAVDSKHSVAKFIRWALTHIDPASVPVNAQLFSQVYGTSPWEYFYGSVRTSTSQSSINSFYNNWYNQQMLRWQYDEITDDWSRSTYATDCQGLLDAWMTHEEGETTDINVQMNYANWCTNKGAIADIDREWVVGEAVFVWSKRLNKMGHIGWICGFDEDGEPLVVEARGLAFGVVVTRLCDRSWSHRGLMTVKFNYDADMKGKSKGSFEEDDFIDLAPSASPVRDIWDGTSASSFGGGSGTEDDPYLINNARQLAYLSDRVADGYSYNGKYFKLTSDIWLNDTAGWESWDCLNAPANIWRPIGYYTNKNNYSMFKGSFDGQGHTVYGVYFSYNRISFHGVFGYVGGNQDGCIKNLNVAQSFMEAVDNVGAIVGYIEGYGRIENCVNYGKVYGDHWIGGAVGCVRNDNGTTVINNCANLGRVRGATDTGGVVGYIYNNCRVTYGANYYYVKAYARTGGIVGRAKFASVDICRNDGIVRGVELVGGLIGNAVETSLRRSYNGHDIIGVYKTGGAVGLMSDASLVENVYNTCSVRANETAGGIAGAVYDSSVNAVYNLGSVSAWRKRGGITGIAGSSAQFTAAYMLEGCCENGTSVGAYLPNHAFAEEDSLLGFDFENIWRVDADTEYPFAEHIALRYSAEYIPEYIPAADPTPEPTPTATPEPTPTAAPEPTPTATPEPTPTATPEPTPEFTPEPTIPPIISTSLPTAAPTPTAAPSDTPEPAPTLYPSASPEPIYGDIDGDGVLTSTDALIILRLALDMLDADDFPNYPFADMNGDGLVTTADALTVLRLASGMND